MKKAIVSGASGFVGKNLCLELISQGVEVFGLDILEKAPLDDKSYHHVQCDLANLEEAKVRLTNIKGVDVFYHLAWKGSAGPLRADYNCQISNALTTVELMKICKEIGVKKFVVAGSIMEYETNKAIYAQGSTPQPAYIYGAGKVLAHLLTKPVANEIGIDLVWAYITNAYGVGELSPRLINTSIRKCINGEELNFSSGVQNYDFLYISDVARAFYLIGEKGKKNKGYLIGSGQAKPLRGFLEDLVEVCNPSLIPNFGSVPFTGVNLNLEDFSIKELEIDCAFKPEVSFKEGIKKTFDWLKGMN